MQALLFVPKFLFFGAVIVIASPLLFWLGRGGCKVRRAKTQQITLALGDLRMTVEADVYGDWAAHHSPHLVGQNDWRVTHVPSGCDIAHVADGLSSADAKQIAKSLGERMPRMGPTKTATVQPRLRPIDRWLLESIIGEALGHGGTK